jgi:lipopolysaccharide export system permease protein
MKKLDRLVIGAYVGPFLITLPVIVFIFLVQFILKYIDELVGKDIGFGPFLELITYFSLKFITYMSPFSCSSGISYCFWEYGRTQ